VAPEVAGRPVAPMTAGDFADKHVLALVFLVFLVILGIHGLIVAWRKR
jgi:hypothetical protein